MKKLLSMIVILAGTVSLVAAAILSCLYLEDLFKFLKGAKGKLAKWISLRKLIKAEPVEE